MIDELRSRVDAYLASTLGQRLLELRASPDGHSGFTYYVTAVAGSDGHAGTLAPAAASADRERRAGTPAAAEASADRERRAGAPPTAEASADRERRAGGPATTEVVRYVLRLPPPGARIAGPADVVRQGRVMAALHAAGLPTPNIVAMVDDPAVLDGRPFILMERLPGQRIEEVAGRFSPREIATAAVKALQALHRLPIEHSGIGDEPPRTLSDEIERWAWLIDRAPRELVGRAPDLAAALRATMPADGEPALVHGDYHYGNLLFSDEGAVSAVLDWEIAEIGTPLVDLGALYVVSQRNVQVDARELAELYGVGYDEARWYFALGMYKYTGIYGYNTMLHRRGKRPDSMYDELAPVIPKLIEEGLELLA